MAEKRSGVIMAVTSTPSRSGIGLMGGVGSAMSTVESITRGLSAELAGQDVRVLGRRSLGVPESDTVKEVYRLHADARGMTWQ